ncbi:MAG TPA: hypothetical protein VE268_05750 [Herpetosiphonaceae bacterium]|jgi:hypothetical protein|nr:hypothetical protein [Herpetosiphonaceae bacterium]
MPGVVDNPALAMYVAAGVALIVLAGFFWYLWSIDRGVAELRRKMKERPSPPQEAAAPLRPQRRVVQEQIDGNTRS